MERKTTSQSGEDCRVGVCVCVSERVYETETRKRQGENEREGNISS